MDRLAEKRKRITEDVLPLARKLLDDKTRDPVSVRYELLNYCRRTWLLSSSVARDYAELALDLVRREYPIPGP